MDNCLVNVERIAYNIYILNTYTIFTK